MDTVTKNGITYLMVFKIGLLNILPAIAPKNIKMTVIFGINQQSRQANAPRRPPVIVTKRGLVYRTREPMAIPTNKSIIMLTVG